MQVRCKYCGTRFDSRDKYCPYCYAKVNAKRNYREDKSEEVSRVNSRYQIQNQEARKSQSRSSSARYSRNSGSSIVNRVIMFIVFVWIFLIFISIISNLIFFF